MTAAKQPLMTATTATGTAYRGTAKALRTAGVDFNRPVIMRGYSIDGVDLYAEPTRYERIEVQHDGSYGVKADGKRQWLGGVATRYWLEQVADEPVAEEQAPEAALEADDSDLDSMTFAQVMVLAKLHKVPGRGTARIAALREGVRKARAEGGLAAREYERIIAE
jgi:hypothetical protein